MALPRSGSIRPVPSSGGDNPSFQATGVDRVAASVVADADLLNEVLRRAVLIDPDAVQAALEEGQRRMELIRDGGYLPQFGNR